MRPNIWTTWSQDSASDDSCKSTNTPCNNYTSRHSEAAGLHGEHRAFSTSIRRRASTLVRTVGESPAETRNRARSALPHLEARCKGVSKFGIRKTRSNLAPSWTRVATASTFAGPCTHNGPYLSCAFGPLLLDNSAPCSLRSPLFDPAQNQRHSWPKHRQVTANHRNLRSPSHSRNFLSAIGKTLHQDQAQAHARMRLVALKAHEHSWPMQSIKRIVNICSAIRVPC